MFAIANNELEKTYIFKIPAIKILREVLPGVSLTEAKHAVEGLPGYAGVYQPPVYLLSDVIALVGRLVSAELCSVHESYATRALYSSNNQQEAEVVDMSDYTMIGEF